jgi:hypothetical protein
MKSDCELFIKFFGTNSGLTLLKVINYDLNNLPIPIGESIIIFDSEVKILIDNLEITDSAYCNSFMSDYLKVFTPSIVNKYGIFLFLEDTTILFADIGDRSIELNDELKSLLSRINMEYFIFQKRGKV